MLTKTVTTEKIRCIDVLFQSSELADEIDELQVRAELQANSTADMTEVRFSIYLHFMLLHLVFARNLGLS